MYDIKLPNIPENVEVVFTQMNTYIMFLGSSRSPIKKEGVRVQITVYDGDGTAKVVMKQFLTIDEGVYDTYVLFQNNFEEALPHWSTAKDLW